MITNDKLTVNRARVTNIFSGPSGALGAGDRGAGQDVPEFTGNPYESPNYVYRWRQYVHLYETSWEARKIIRIPIEDALRKPWEIQDIPEEMAQHFTKRFESLRVVQALSRSLMLERLLGGCLTFLGMEDDVDDPSKPHNPRVNPGKLHFLNAIPCSRITRIQWETNPLKEHYMRPSTYVINGNEVHTTRCLVWDGEPLFDPYDFALTNFRANLQGFGPSKLATIWDDIKNGQGTRQAAYHLIQTNNAIIMAVNELQSLQGTKSGKEALRKLKDVANQLSTYRAALIESDKVSLSQHSASFGSVPELIITWLQVLSAASDIPATRFLGQAPGGLNATGESDLENYYNMVDALQTQRIAPQLRKLCDIEGYQFYPNVWHKVREKMTLKFPPLWNVNELEEAQKNQIHLDNALKLVEQGLMSDEKFLEEINAKKVFSVDLDEKDIDVMRDTETPNPLAPQPGGKPDPQGDPNTPTTLPNTTKVGTSKGDRGLTPPDPAKEIKRLRNIQNAKYFPMASELLQRVAEKKSPLVTTDEVFTIGDALEIDWSMIPFEEFYKGFLVELEHVDVTKGDPIATAKVALAHINERLDYYTQLAVHVENSDKCVIYDASGLSTVKTGRYSQSMVKKIAEAYDADVIEFTQSSARLRDKMGRLLWVEPARFLRGKLQNRFIPVTSVDRTPSEARMAAGNYKKHHLRIHGLEVAIENPQGTERHGTNPDGTSWSSILPAHYGYIKRTEGADGAHVDVYIGPHEESPEVFLIDQVDAETKAFDEHKCIFGAMSITQAKELYLKAFSDGRGEIRLGAMTPLTVDQFKQWLKEGDTKSPYAL